MLTIATGLFDYLPKLFFCFLVMLAVRSEMFFLLRSPHICLYVLGLKLRANRKTNRSRQIKLYFIRLIASNRARISSTLLLLFTSQHFVEFKIELPKIFFFATASSETENIKKILWLQRPLPHLTTRYFNNIHSALPEKLSSNLFIDFFSGRLVLTAGLPLYFTESCFGIVSGLRTEEKNEIINLVKSQIHFIYVSVVWPCEPSINVHSKCNQFHAQVEQ